MREYGLQARVRRRKHPKGYYRRKKEAMENLPGNVLDRNFTAKRPLQKLVTDVTYLPIKGGWCYFGPVMDLSDREIVPYVLFLSVRLDLSRRMLDKPVPSDLDQDAMLHSDRGSIYTAIAYRDRLKHMGVVQSMSRSGNCWDNVCIESFFGHMKDELGIRKNGKGELMGYSNMKKVIADWVREYNTVRPHSVLDGMSPIGYRIKMLYPTKECLQ
jgi:transposase InsO family protein